MANAVLELPTQACQVATVVDVASTARTCHRSIPLGEPASKRRRAAPTSDISPGDRGCWRPSLHPASTWQRGSVIACRDPRARNRQTVLSTEPRYGAGVSGDAAEAH